MCFSSCRQLWRFAFLFLHKSSVVCIQGEASEHTRPQLMLMGGGVDSPAPPMLPLRSTRTVHIPPTRSLVFPADRNPLLPPPARKTDLPFSSQDRFSSPEKDNYVSAQNSHERDQAEQEKEMPARAGPSRPRQPPLPRPVLVSMSDEEDDFDGIEDVLPTQEDPIDRPRPTPRGEAFGKAKLADLFADDEDRAESPSYQARPKLRPDSAQAGLSLFHCVLGTRFRDCISRT